MHKDSVVTLYVAFAAGLLVGALAVTLSLPERSEMRAGIEKEAVEAGAGEFYLDKEHNRQFRWKATLKPLGENNA